MREYALMTLNTTKYANIYLTKEGAEYARTLSVSDAVHSIRSLYQLSKQRHIRNTVKYLRWGVFQKE